VTNPITDAFRAGWVAGQAGIDGTPESSLALYTALVMVPPTLEDIEVFRSFIERSRGSNPLTIEALKRLVDAWS